MKLLIVLCLVAVALGDKGAKINNQQFQINEDKSYESKLKTSNGIASQEDGVLTPDDYVRSGSYTHEWEGQTYTVNWVADQNGFRAEGEHLPK